MEKEERGEGSRLRDVPKGGSFALLLLLELVVEEV